MANSDSEIQLRSSARTSIGQVRENNEDTVQLWAEDQYVLAVVADGMGGAVAGEEASRIAVEAVQQEMTSPEDAESLPTLNDDLLIEKLCESIRTANLNIVRRAAANPEMRGMGTTITLAMVRSTSAIVAHVGDSRAYLVDSGSRRITQITADHTFVEALVSAGHLTPDQASEHPMRNVLYRALGQHEDVAVDIYEAHLRAGDRLVLCSDGLTRHVRPAEITTIVSDAVDPDIASDELIALANDRGGEDNVSVIVVALDGIVPDAPEVEKDAFFSDDDTVKLKDPRIANAVAQAIRDAGLDPDKTLNLNNGLDQVDCCAERSVGVGVEGRDTFHWKN